MAKASNSPYDIPVAHRPLLSMGSKGPSVEHLQRLLNSILDETGNKPILKPDGGFGQMTEDAVSLFQHRYGLPITGCVGEVDWRALEQSAQPSSGGLDFAVTKFMGALWPKPSGFEPQMLLASIAVPYIGARETGDNKMGSDPRMKEIFEADDLTVDGYTDGYPWCAAFVSLCTQKLIKNFPIHYAAVTPPRQPSVARFLNDWALHQRCLIFKPTSRVIKAVPGDIVIFTFSHIGIVERINDGELGTIEGNTNEEGSREGTAVQRKARSTSIVRRFIRLPVFRGSVS